MRSSTATARRKHLAFLVLAMLFCCSSVGILKSDETDTSTQAYSKFESREAEIADAVKKNGEIFVGWEKPELTLLISGEMDGYLEPCGCAGLENQLGGMKRRHTFFKQLQSQDWPIVSLDMGGLVRRVGPQSEIKYRFALNSLIELGYSVVGLGARELQLSSNALIFALANLDPEKNPIVSANVGLFGFESGFSKTYQVIENGGKRIGVTSVLGAKHKQELANASDINWLPPEEALQKVVPQLEAEKCDFLILLVHADPQEARQLARKFPQFKFVATTGGAEVPPKDSLEPIENTDSFLAEAGHKGMYVTVIGFFDNKDEPFKVQRVPLDHRFEDSSEMQQMLVNYQEELKGTGFDGLGITGVKNSVDQFVGSETCGECHTTAMEIFEETPHSHATQSIVTLTPPRHFDPECLSCHVTGWEPQEYFPYESGFQSLELTPHLTANGCENCHGPGKAHVDAEMGDVEATEEQLEELRARMRLKIVENEGNKDGQVFKEAVVVKMCMECHDLDNSPDFDFQEYWPHIEHVGKD